MTAVERPIHHRSKKEVAPSTGKALRVKSVDPPARPLSELFLFIVTLAAAACLDTDVGRDVWSALSNSAGGPKAATVFLVIVVPNIVYYVNSAFFAVLDLCLYNHPAVKALKVQPSSPRPTVAEYAQAALVTGFNTFIIEPLLIWSIYEFVWPAIGHCAWTEDACHTMPSPMLAVGSLLFWVLIEETGFYVTHRLVHQPPLYKWIHKMHHTFKSPAALTSKYAHPVEHLLSNLGPVVLGPLLFNCHPLVQCLWTSYGLVQTTVVHSGYNLSPWLPQPNAHDWHHEVTYECYGTELGLLDWLFGTNPRFLARMARKLPVHIIGVDDGVKVDETWEDSDEEGVGPPGGGAMQLKTKQH